MDAAESNFPPQRDGFSMDIDDSAAGWALNARAT
jgi:hypothetical protein